MKKYFVISLLILAGCKTALVKEPSYMLQPGTRIIMRGHDDAWEMRKAFRNETDFWRIGSVVELREPLLVVKPQP